MEDIIKDAKKDLERIMKESVEMAKADLASTFTAVELSKIINEGLAEVSEELEEEKELEESKSKEEVSEEKDVVIDMTESDDEALSEFLNSMSSDDEVHTIAEDDDSADETDSELDEMIKTLKEEADDEIKESETKEKEMSEGMIGKKAYINGEPFEIVSINKAEMKYRVKDKDGKEKEVDAKSVGNISEESESEMSEGLVGKKAYINGEPHEITKVNKAEMKYTVKDKDGKEKEVDAKSVGNISESEDEDMGLSEDDLMEALKMMETEGDEKEVEENLVLSSIRKHQAGIEVPQNQIPSSALDSKMTGIVSENKKLKTEIKKLKGNEKLFVESYKELKSQFNELTVFNTNLVHVNDIFSSEVTTMNEKLDIINKFKKVKSIDESIALHKKTLSELKEIKSSNAKTIEETIQKHVTSEKSKVKIEENVGIPNAFTTINSFMARMNKVDEKHNK